MEEKYQGVVSVIVPVYNVEKYIVASLDSLLAQTYSKLEILLIDDGSTDACPDICDEYAKRDARVQVIHQLNSGVSKARNVGLAASHGEFIGFMDPDDLIEPTMFETLVREIQLRQADVIFCGFYEDIIETNRVIVHSPEKTGMVNGTEGVYQCCNGIGSGYFSAVWGKLFSRKALLQNGAFPLFPEDIAIGEDELWLVDSLKILQKVWLLNTPLYHWIVHPTSAVHSTKITPRALTGLTSKERLAENVEELGPQFVQLMQAKLYRDHFYLLLSAYEAHDKEAFHQIFTRIQKGRHAFWKAPEYSYKIKTKLAVLCFLMECHVPFTLISFIWNWHTINGKKKK